ncbi:MAG TPA: ATP-binding protein [Burkholderiales bacterium]|nr:ATP-binding protein [Burkholderiales bacterium]
MNGNETTIRNRREELTRVVEAVNRLAAEHHLIAEVVKDMQVALDEVLSNIVDYGYADDAEHEIRIRLRLLDNVLEATIEDDGVPFNPLDRGAPDTRAPLRERRIGGVGLHFVKNLMSEVRYDRVGNRNRLVLRKKLTA